MDRDKKLNILFIEENQSMLDLDTQMFTELFHKVEKVSGNENALKCIYKNQYDIIINDITVKALEGTRFMKEIKQMKPEQEVVVLVSENDENKIGEALEAGINAFVLTPVQFDQALETIAQMNPAKKDKN